MLDLLLGFYITKDPKTNKEKTEFFNRVGSDFWIWFLI
ncbi:hypothetical protein AO498_11587 [Algoriphagus sanaruensis]|uniref:Uncharacterized protein n=1 Tax=Algoriphagus sanaruensis TaxID=1727163 RepID=A0A142EPM5_9BACT|nr:hypothetical protein AO498_11587 [Algoriphagus sanaruensis]